MSTIRHHLSERLDRARISRYRSQQGSTTRMQRRATEHVARAQAGGIDYI